MKPIEAKILIIDSILMNYDNDDTHNYPMDEDQVDTWHMVFTERLYALESVYGEVETIDYIRAHYGLSPMDW